VRVCKCCSQAPLTRVEMAGITKQDTRHLFDLASRLEAGFVVSVIGPTEGYPNGNVILAGGPEVRRLRVVDGEKTKS